MPAWRVGGAEHKALFCREFVDTFTGYEVREVRWPTLAPADLESLLGHCGIPLPDDLAETPRDPEGGFLRMGYGECFERRLARYDPRLLRPRLVPRLVRQGLRVIGGRRLTLRRPSCAAARRVRALGARPWRA
jgi:hypothetical protein